jgi:hypothetical protein
MGPKPHDRSGEAGVGTGLEKTFNRHSLQRIPRPLRPKTSAHGAARGSPKSPYGWRTPGTRVEWSVRTECGVRHGQRDLLRQRVGPSDPDVNASHRNRPRNSTAFGHKQSRTPEKAPQTPQPTRASASMGNAREKAESKGGERAEIAAAGTECPPRDQRTLAMLP